MRIVIISSLIISFFAALFMGGLTCMKFIGGMQGPEVLLIVLGRAILTFGTFFCLSLMLGTILKIHVPQLAYLLIDKEIEYTMPMIIPGEAKEEEEWPSLKVEEVELERSILPSMAQEEPIIYGHEQAEQIALALRTWMSDDEDNEEKLETSET
ncbi:hypothetical protein HY792_00470 [Candidatus Desantisbacteria bacterium]|nr:hypothetical protein [Candidatus Desantisbacteria bacterium]